MNAFIRKSLGWLLVLAIIASLVLPGVPVPGAVEVSAATTTITRPADTDVQNGVTLHCWNWSYKNIETNMAKIASLGYTAVQVSPIQQTKQPTLNGPMNDWWALYQPADFRIDNTGTSALGTKADFMSLCETAHEYGVYVIVDVVANHMAQESGTKRSPLVIDDIENDDSCWHNKNESIGSDYSSRERITQYDLDSVLDLNTSSKKIQNYVLNYLKECIDAGADGFRFDAVKHIETPDDPANIASDFWPTVIYGAEEYAESKGLDLYCYGELLDHPDESGTLPDSAYTKYYSITDNSWGNTVRESVVNGGNASSFSGGYHKNVSADNIVLWAESHDTFTNGSSTGSSTTNLHKTWALVTARADAMSLYLARRQDVDSEMFGNIYTYEWSNPEVAAANKFHNAFVGQSEYVANSGSIAYVERGTSGVVLVNCGGTSTSVSVPANQIANGTYTDQITGNTFTVSGGKITGQIGSTGIAVVYNATACQHTAHNSQGICTSCFEAVGHKYVSGTCACGAQQVSEYVIYFKNTGNWSKVNVYAWSETTGTYTGEWPGTAMTKVEGNIYKCTVPGGAEKIIFNDGTSQTPDMVIPTAASGLDMYDFSAGSWGSYGGNTGCTHAEHRYNGNCRACGTAVGHTYTNGVCSCGAEQPIDTNIYYLYGWINGAGAYEKSETWRMTNGKINVRFSQESYVAVMAYHGVCFQTVDSQRLSNPATLYNASMLSHQNVGTASMLTVPGNVDLTITFKPDGKGQFVLSYGPQEGACQHPGHNTSGVCTSCGQTVGHNFSGDTCTVCGYTKPADRVIYFENTAGWSKVNAYSWNDAGYSNGTWPGVAMTKVEGNIYSITLSGEATYVIFNNGTDQTDDLTLPSDKDLYTFSTDSWSVYGDGSDCDHADHGTDGKCTACGATVSHSYDSGKVTTAAGCTTAGVKTYTCSVCGGTKTESIAATGHNYVDGTCASCGASEPVVTDKVIYFQNTASWATPYVYSWDANGTATTGSWPGSKMTALGDGLYSYTVPGDAVNVIFNNGGYSKTDDLTIPTDSKNLYTYSSNTWSEYVPPVPRVIYFQNTAGWTTPYIYTWDASGSACSGTWPGSKMTAVSGVSGLYQYTVSGDAVNVIFNNGSGTKTDDLTIPTDGKDLYTYSTGVWTTYTEETPCEHPSHDVSGKCTACGETVGHSYSGGSCTVCGAADPNYSTVVQPSLSLNYGTVSFESEIQYNIYFNASNLDSVVEMGMITFDSQLTDGTIDDAVEVYSDYSTDGSVYMVATEGIAAKNMADQMWFKIYAKLSDGSYVYTTVNYYSAVRYATSILNRTSSSSYSKALVVAMLNYGAEAQLYFGHNTDNLANAGLTDAQKALNAAYDESMVDAVVTPTTSKAANFVYTASAFTNRYPSVSFDGAFSINFYFAASQAPDNGMTFYYWDQETYDSVSALTKDNATETTDMTMAGTNSYYGVVDSIAAKEMDETVFVAGVYEVDGVEYTTGIIAYSLGKYCETIAAKDTSDQQAFAQATAVYGYYAKEYFANL